MMNMNVVALRLTTKSHICITCVPWQVMLQTKRNAKKRMYAPIAKRKRQVAYAQYPGMAAPNCSCQHRSPPRAINKHRQRAPSCNAPNYSVPPPPPPPPRGQPTRRATPASRSPHCAMYPPTTPCSAVGSPPLNGPINVRHLRRVRPLLHPYPTSYPCPSPPRHATPPYRPPHRACRFVLRGEWRSTARFSPPGRAHPRCTTR